MLLYAPQCVGYARIALLGAALLSGAAQPHLTVSLFLANFILDGLDGYLARTLQQVRSADARQPQDLPILLIVCMQYLSEHAYTMMHAMQTSAFGAFLDVAIDCCSRGVLYVWALEGPLAALPITAELLTFVATHKVQPLLHASLAVLHA